MNDTPEITAETVTEFIDRWKKSGAAERANHQLFATELCDVLGVPRPEPARPDDRENFYVFERAVTFHHGDGSTSTGFIDLYKRGCFVLEAKQGSDPSKERKSSLTLKPSRATKKGTAVRGSRGWDDAMVRARGQAEAYAKALPAEEGWPPFLVVVDVAHTIELFADFSRTGKHYTQFPDASSFRIPFAELANESIQERLRLVWTDPLALDPASRTARVTREIADRLARLAKSLEAEERDPKSVAAFLMRCLFTMFAEDVGLLPKGGFTELLVSLKGSAEKFQPMVSALWRTMKDGGFSSVLREDLLRFNGGLFAGADALPVSEEQLELLIEAGEADWQDVEPAIFGTLLERALEPRERHKLGAHYTPRAYVERLVMPTVIEPLREEWENVKASAVLQANKGRTREPISEVKGYHRRLCAVRVLDPACGSGNFLYVTMEHMKRLEGEVLDLLGELGETQYLLEIERHTVDPHQFLGLELNPRAAVIAELVLWIGYLQWHFKTRGRTMPAQPVLKDFKNIECRDAVLAWDDIELVRGDDGKPVTRWDGHTFKTHPVTGNDVPDESARVELERYVNPRPAKWPEADYIVGNPPFVGNKRMRLILGDGLVEALRAAYPEVPEVSDYVMYWWDKSANYLDLNGLKRFGLITTNSITQSHNRKVLLSHIDGNGHAYILYAIPDHPWVDSADGAAVRVAMTVVEGGKRNGVLELVGRKKSESSGEISYGRKRRGRIHSNLTIGPDVSKAKRLRSNSNISFMGVTLVGKGFRLSREELSELFPSGDVFKDIVRRYVIGREIAQISNDRFVIDLYGHREAEVRSWYPQIYQWLVDRVRPERLHNKRPAYREKWWIFGEPRSVMRRALDGCHRYIVTLETSKHRYFIFLPNEIISDHTLFVIASDKAFDLGVLSSRLHCEWALAAGSRVGYGNDPRWRNKTCFEPFPFPACDDEHKLRIRDLGEQLDGHRKARQEAHPELTMTAMYNVLEKLRGDEALTSKEKETHEQGLVSVLRQIHDDLDEAVFAAYGWSSDLSDEAILERLVALNSERAEEEARGLVRWLRPEFQAPGEAPAAAVQGEMAVAAPEPRTPKGKRKKADWPKGLAEQVRAVRDTLSIEGRPLTTKEVARVFKGARSDRVGEVLETLVALGQAREAGGDRFAA